MTKILKEKPAIEAWRQLMFTYLSVLPPMWTYVYYSIWLTGIVIIAGIVTLLFYPIHYKKIALFTGITGLLEIIFAGFLYYPYTIFIVFPAESAMGLIALTSGAIITIYGKLKMKYAKVDPKNNS